MSNLNSLDLPELDEGEEQVPDFDTLPQQIGDFADPIQPGPYVFTLPKAGPVYEAVVDFENKPRLKAKFHDAAQLKIQDSVDRYRFTVNSIPQNKGEGKPKVSAMTYLLAAVNEVPKTYSRRDMGEALDRACVREGSFLGTTSLSSYCPEDKDIYLPDEVDEKGTVTKQGGKQAGTKGCGRRYSSNPYKPNPEKAAKAKAKFGGERFPIPKDPVDPGKYALRFRCKCGNMLRAYSQIDVFRKAS